MIIQKNIDLLDVLDGHVPEDLYAAMNRLNIVSLSVEFEITNYQPGRPHLSPPEPTEYEQHPAEDYGKILVDRLKANPATQRFMTTALEQKIKKALNDYLFSEVDLCSEVAAEDADWKEHVAGDWGDPVNW